MNLRDYLRLLRRRWAFLVIVALLGLGITAGWLTTQTPQYTATAQTLVAVNAASNVSDASAGATFAQTAAKNFATVATSPYVLSKVVSDLHLSSSPAQLMSQVKATALLDTSVISISATAASPAQAAAVANTVTVELGDSVSTLNPNVGNAASVVRSTQIATALPPSSPSYPQIPIDLALGLLAGLALAVVIVIARDAVDTRLRDTDQLGVVVPAPMLGIVPNVLRPAWSPTAVSSTPPQTLDAFRTLRTKLRYGTANRPIRALVVASPDEGAVAAHAVTQLAESFARAGERVLVIDAQPSTQFVGAYFGASDSIGLVDALESGRAVETTVRASAASGVWVLSPGGSPSDFSEWIRSERMVFALQELQQRFSIILIAPEPLLSSQDGAVLAKHTDGALIVCRSGHTTATDAHGAVQVLDGVGAAKVGAVIVLPETGRIPRGSTKKRHRSVAVESAPAIAAS